MFAIIYYTVVVRTINVSTKIAVDTATVGCISSETNKGENMIPPPTPTIEDNKPPKKAIVVTQTIFESFH